jgi:hypothetical protein
MYVYYYKMYGPMIIKRVLQPAINNYKYNTKIVSLYSTTNDPFLDAVRYWFISSPPNPLGRWCHKSSDTYKNKCNPEKKIDFANMDNSHQHDDGVDVMFYSKIKRD